MDRKFEKKIDKLKHLVVNICIKLSFFHLLIEQQADELKQMMLDYPQEANIILEYSFANHFRIFFWIETEMTPGGAL